MTRLWIVRAGKQGDRELAAIEQDRLLPGFLDVGDLRRFPDRDAILEHLEEVMPNGGRNRLRNFAAQLNQFAHTIQVGDLVVMPRKLTDGVAIGEVTGNYVFSAEDPYKHSRPVSWSEESVPRDTFKQDLRYSLGAFMTICEVRRNSALDRVRAVLETGTDPGSLLGRLGEDRICVQVKSGDGAANHDVVLRLIGSVSNTQAQTGLLVSIGGVNAAARKELDNNFFKLRLWQMPDLLKALFRSYGELSDSTRAKLPLKHIWAPISEGDA